MVTQKLQINLTKMIGIINNSDEATICRVIIINNDTKWKKSIKDAIYNDSTLFPYKYYDVTCERYIDDECIKTQFSGCINLQVEKLLNSMDTLECMIITITTMVDIYNKEKGMLEKPKVIYVIAKN